MSAVGQTSQYQQNTNEWDAKRSPDPMGYNPQYQSRTSFLDKYRPKTASYSSSKDINNR